MPSTRRSPENTPAAPAPRRARLLVTRIARDPARFKLEVEDQSGRCLIYAHAVGGQVALAGINAWVDGMLPHSNTFLQVSGRDAHRLAHDILGPLDFAAHRTLASLAVAA